MSVTGILQSNNRTPKCLSLLKSTHFYTTTFDTYKMAVTFPSFLK
ncbi:hypothetical protein T12_6655 [Trichinella patagoniensis]|uniref:Uncharacterized protein n=1 Tax=Trichinella patagoniensis TaxID=990121 RepID=A0A0V0Y0V8_9BILA|nr:hypothetical protein T12_6655 [Trichinella patagoniensis]